MSYLLWKLPLAEPLGGNHPHFCQQLGCLSYQDNGDQVFGHRDLAWGYVLCQQSSKSHWKHNIDTFHSFPFRKILWKLNVHFSTLTMFLCKFFDFTEIGIARNCRSIYIWLGRSILQKVCGIEKELSLWPCGHIGFNVIPGWTRLIINYLCYLFSNFPRIFSMQSFSRFWRSVTERFLTSSSVRPSRGP